MNSCQKIFTVALENVCSLAYETSSLINMRYFGMFIAAVCLLLLAKALNFVTMDCVTQGKKRVNNH